MPNKKLAQEWFDKGDEDELVVEALLKNKTSPNIACFHSQQVAEKYLKGFLVYSEREFEKIHAIPRLLELCAEIEPAFSSLKETASTLMPFYVGPRYPGDLSQFTFADAERALGAAKKIKAFVLEKLW